MQCEVDPERSRFPEPSDTSSHEVNLTVPAAYEDETIFINTQTTCL